MGGASSKGDGPSEILLVGDYTSGIQKVKSLLEGSLNERAGATVQVRIGPTNAAEMQQEMKKQSSLRCVLYVANGRDEAAASRLGAIFKERSSKKLAGSRELVVCDNCEGMNNSTNNITTRRVAQQNNADFVNVDLDGAGAASELEEALANAVAKK